MARKKAVANKLSNIGTAQIIAKLLVRAETDPNVLEDAFQLNRQLRDEGAVDIDGRKAYDQDNFDRSAENSTAIRRLCAAWIKTVGLDKCVDIYKRTLLFDAPNSFDAYCRYIEWDRPTKKRFYEPRRKQLLPIANAMQDLADGKLELLAISLPPGVGKALANDTPILTRNGWKKHGDLVVGDEVIGMDGRFKKVIAIHPKCELDCLVEFTNGEKIVCHENHEWWVRDRRCHKEYIAETKEIEKSDLNIGGEPGHRGHRYTFQLPRQDYVVGEEKELFVDPYTMGVWLGDGANLNPTICCSGIDSAVIERIVRNGGDLRWATIHKITGVLYFGIDIRKGLQKYGMCYSRHRSDKFIPEEYLTASIDQRVELLAGLIDTDGTLQNGKFTFTTAEETLKDSFVSLLSTFGWRACVRYNNPGVSTSGICSRKGWYTVSFTPDCVIPCEIRRKRNNRVCPHRQRSISIKSITRCEPREGNCITVEGDGMYLAGKTMIPTHNTTLSLFFLTWFLGRRPDLTALGGSHSNSFLHGIYDEIIRVLDRNGEYLYNDVFPNAPMVDTNSKDMRIDLVKPKRFQNYQFSSIGSGNAGKVRASGILYCDDLVDGIETAMSRDRLDKLWQQYYTDLRQRKMGGGDDGTTNNVCKELHVATRWSIADPIGRLESQYEGNPAAKFLRFPALDENDESNFDYPYGVGFTTDFYRQQRDIMDQPSWEALYMNEPIEREGQLYAPDELRWFFSLPEAAPDAIIAICDTKEQGNDYLAMPIFKQYGEDYYLDTWICDNGKVEILVKRVANSLKENNVRLCRIESNRGGTLFAKEVQQELRQIGGTTTITTKWTQTNKETRIQVNSGWVKEHILFRDSTVSNREYKTAMNQLVKYTMAGKNKHDDIPDVLSLFVDMVASSELNVAKIMRRPF